MSNEAEMLLERANRCNQGARQHEIASLCNYILNSVLQVKRGDHAFPKVSEKTKQLKQILDELDKLVNVNIID